MFEPELKRGLANKSETSNVLTSRIACIILFAPAVIVTFNFYIFMFNFFFRATLGVKEVLQLSKNSTSICVLEIRWTGTPHIGSRVYCPIS